jgi:flagellar biosynthesis/type III secretory pathway chaperone
MQPQNHRPLPQAAALQSMNAQELMEATLRLSDVLAEENALLDTRNYREIARLHDEKLKLSSLLEAYQERMARDPNFMRTIDAKSREELLLRTDDLACNVEDNFRKVSVARAVNGRIVQAIMDVMSDQQRPSVYGRNGQAAPSGDLALSMNLNQKA